MPILLAIDTAGGSNFEGYPLKNVGSLQVNGATDLDSTLDVAGNTTIGGTVSVTGTLSVTGASTLAKLSVTGATTLQDLIQRGTKIVRIENVGTDLPVGAIGIGLELSVKSGVGTIDSYDRTGGAYAPLQTNSPTTIANTLSVTGALTASAGITGNLTGNATTATTLATSRTFSITGDIVASGVSFNGAANVALASTYTGTVPINKGGTGLTTVPANGQLLVGNAGNYSLANLTPGTGIGISNAAGSITVTNTGVTSLVAGSGIGVSGATGGVTVTNSGVLAVSSGTGISVSGTNTNRTITNTGVTSFNGRSGAVSPAASDYSFSQLSGNIAISQIASGVSASASTFLRGDNTWASVSMSGHGAYRNSNQVLSPTSTWQNIIPNITEFGSGIINAGTGVATVVSAGLYYIQAAAARTVGGGPNDNRLLINATPTEKWNVDSDVVRPFATLMYLAAGTQITLQALDNSSGVTIGGDKYRTHLYIVRLSPSI